MAASDWRSAAAYEYVRFLDPADIAWEFLRRSPEYQQDYRQVVREKLDDWHEAELLKRWGLRFRERSEPDSP